MNETILFPTAIPTGYLASTTDHALLAFSGADSADFLNRQLSNDIVHLGLDAAIRAAYCTPKGRMLADMLLWRSEDAIFMMLDAELAEALRKKLTMYVLRAQVKIGDAGSTHAILHLGGIDAAAALQQLLGEVPQTVGQHLGTQGLDAIRSSDAGAWGPRYLLVGEKKALAEAASALRKHLTSVAPAVARLAAIHAGEPRIVPTTVEKFVPQMINQELIGAVNFKKGCYPGQEIVARTQYRGQTKRRTFAASLDSRDAVAGMEIFSATKPDEPCGLIVNAERNLNGGSDCLVELQIAVRDTTLHLNNTDGPTLHFFDLPYVIPTTSE